MQSALACSMDLIFIPIVEQMLPRGEAEFSLNSVLQKLQNDSCVETQRYRLLVSLLLRHSQPESRGPSLEQMPSVAMCPWESSAWMTGEGALYQAWKVWVGFGMSQRLA